MVLTIELKNIIEDIAANYSLKLLKETANKLSDKYLNESGNGLSLANSEIDIISYAVMRMPATYAAISFALNESLKGMEINTVLDVGSGMGTATFASYFYGLNNASFTCIEKEKEMVKLAKKLFSFYPNIDVDFIQEDYLEKLPKQKYDLVIAAYSLNELNEKDRKSIIDSLWEITDKILIVIEPGTPVGYKEIRDIRTQLLNKQGSIVAPCTHTDECPIKDDDWCHFVTRVERSKLHKYLKGGDVPFEDEKFSYIAISKSHSNCAYQYRVLRHPQIGNGNISLTLCTKEGIINKRYFKSHSQYKQLKKIKTGEGFND